MITRFMTLQESIEDSGLVASFTFEEGSEEGELNIERNSLYVNRNGKLILNFKETQKLLDFLIFVQDTLDGEIEDA